MRKSRKIDSLSAQRVREVLDYCPDTGDFFWTDASPKKCVSGSKAGHSLGKHKGVKICIDGVVYRSCLLAFICMGKKPPMYVKYKDNDRDNTKWDNLSGSDVFISSRRTVSVSSDRRAMFSSCPLSPGVGGTSVTKFNSKAAFFRSCCAKQTEARVWGTSKLNDKLTGGIHPYCKGCVQAKGSRLKEVVVDFNSLGIIIDENLGVER